MNSKHSSLTKREVHDLAHAILQTCLKFHDYSSNFKATRLISVLLFGICQAISLTATSRRVASFPSDETVRKALVDNLPEREELEARLNAGLADRLPKALRKGRWPIAIDYCDQPYYGKKTPDVRRGRAQRGTTRCHTYATAFVVRNGYRFTLAVTWVSPDDSMIKVLHRLLARVDQLGVKISYLLLDRAFYEADVLRDLQQTKRPYLMPVKLRGRKPKNLAASTSAYQFLSWRRSGWSQYSWTDKQGQQIKVNICVSLRRYVRHGRRQQQVLLFAYYGFKPSSPAWARETYRTRFGIETSYRQVNQARIPTTSRDPLRRLLFVGLALIIRNVWAWIHLVYFRRRGKIRLEIMPLPDMLYSITKFIEVIYGCLEIFGSTHESDTCPRPAMNE
jgi:hypothetical protein